MGPPGPPILILRRALGVHNNFTTCNGSMTLLYSTGASPNSPAFALLSFRLRASSEIRQSLPPISSTINQQAIAERLKLSRTTVSRSLANHPAISADTRAQVQNLAAKMGYRGNPTRTLRRSRQSKPLTIGILIGVPAENVAMATFPFILQGIRERSGMEHVAIDVCFENPGSLEPSVRPQNIFRNIRGGDWRGTVLIYPFPEHTVGLIARKISAV